MKLELLSHLTYKTLDDMRQQGISSIVELAVLSPDELTRFKGIKTKAPAVHAQIRAYVESRPIVYGSLPEDTRHGGWCFDIETLAPSDQVWCIGWGEVDQPIHVALVNPYYEAGETIDLADGTTIIMQPDTTALWRCFAHSIPPGQTPIYHWTGFDSAVMRKTAPPDVIDAVGARLCDLHQRTTRAVQFPVRSTGIKAIADYLGFRWSVYADWSQALYDYRYWLRTDDLATLQRARSYQHDDVAAMQVVWRWLVENGLG